MSFCTLDEAFIGPPNLPGPRQKKPKRQNKEGFSSGGGVVPHALVGAPGTTRTSEEVLAGPPPATAPTEEAISMDTLFPMPGETGGADEWQKAFTLEGSAMPQPVRPDGSVPVAGKPTLWRQIPTPQVAAVAAPYQRGPVAAAASGWLPAPAPLQTPGAETVGLVPSELSQRLDVLTRQLENLTAPTQLQGTAELFLFVAIGLLLLLAIDTLLRFAVAAGSAVLQNGGRRARGFGRIRGSFR